MTSAYLRRALRRLDEERRQLLEETGRQSPRRSPCRAVRFSRLSFEGKKSAAARFIRQIRVAEEDAEVYWNV